MTWLEFKNYVESHGVTDNMEVHLIDVYEPEAGWLDIWHDNNQFCIQ